MGLIEVVTTVLERVLTPRLELGWDTQDLREVVFDPESDFVDKRDREEVVSDLGLIEVVTAVLERVLTLRLELGWDTQDSREVVFYPESVTVDFVDKPGGVSSANVNGSSQRKSRKSESSFSTSESIVKKSLIGSSKGKSRKSESSFSSSESKSSSESENTGTSTVKESTSLCN